MAPTPVEVLDNQHRWNNWESWRPQPRPDISDVLFWGKSQPWHEKASSKHADRERTLDWHDRGDLRVRTNVGTTGGADRPGIPFQRIDGVTRLTRVYHATQPGSWLPWAWNPFPSVQVPLPERVERYGDPAGSTWTDSQWYGVNRNEYWEVSAIGPSWMGFPHPWRADNISRYVFNRPWEQQRVGMIAARVPLLPMLTTFEELESGYIDHAHQFVAALYNSREVVGYARATDGTIAGHPLRAGDVVRLRPSAVDISQLTPHARVLVTSLIEFGAVVADKTHPLSHSIRLPQDPRVDLGDLNMHQYDFEIVQTI